MQKSLYLKTVATWESIQTGLELWYWVASSYTQHENFDKSIVLPATRLFLKQLQLILNWA